jgi:nickel/cobalt exporter
VRLTAALALGAVGLAAAALWSSGALAAIGWWAFQQQRALQGLLAGELTALRGGERAALWGLIGLCAAYGFLHAVGPGHGKALVAGAAAATRATARRMALIALAGSLGQAGVAIALVYGGFALLGASARALTGNAEAWAQPIGTLAVALIGAWLLVRGLRALRPAIRGEGAGGHAPGHGAPCGHDHGPSPEAAARATGLGATLALVAAMAARPCTGAIFVLVIAWRIGAPAAGAAAVVAMGLGAAAFTALVAWLAVTSREAAFLSAGSKGAARLLGPGLQVVTGGLMLAAGGLLLAGAFA